MSRPPYNLWSNPAPALAPEDEEVLVAALAALRLNSGQIAGARKAAETRARSFKCRHTLQKTRVTMS